MLEVTDINGTVTTTPLTPEKVTYLRGKDLSDVTKFGAMLAFYVEGWSGVEFDSITAVKLVA